MTDDFTSSKNARNRFNGDTYLHEFRQAAATRLARGKHGRIHELDRDDIASRMVVRVLLNLEDYRRRYPKPEKLAAVMLDQAVIGYQRAEGAQRGEGTRGGRKVHHLDDAELPIKAHDDKPRLDARDTYVAVRRRRHVRVDALSSLTSTGFDGPGDHLNHDEVLQAHRHLDAALLGQGVDRRGRWLLQRVDGDGLTVTEAACALGIARETAQRALGKARKAASAAAAQWRADGRPLPW